MHVNKVDSRGLAYFWRCCALCCSTGVYASFIASGPLVVMFSITIVVKKKRISQELIPFCNSFVNNKCRTATLILTRLIFKRKN